MEQKFFKNVLDLMNIEHSIVDVVIFFFFWQQTTMFYSKFEFHKVWQCLKKTAF